MGLRWKEAPLTYFGGWVFLARLVFFAASGGEAHVMPKALITGITGQDGSYLAELLLAKGYTVYGMARRASHFNDIRIRHLLNDIEILDADLVDQLSLISALRYSRPDEVYNLAAMSFVGTS